jgi:hypothetical protein
VGRVVKQLQERPLYLYLYLTELSHRDPHLVANFANAQLKLTAQYVPSKLIEFLRASSYYTLEEALKVCQERELVPEQVFVLGRMGNNKAALTLIIEKMDDVNRVRTFLGRIDPLISRSLLPRPSTLQKSAETMNFGRIYCGTQKLVRASSVVYSRTLVPKSIL